LWDIGTSECIHIYSGHTMSVNSIMFAPNMEQFASGSSDGTVRIWGTEGEASGCAILEGHTGEVLCVACSTDGMHIASAGNGHDWKILLWGSHENSWELLRHFPCLTSPVNALIFSDTRHIYSGSFDGELCVRDIHAIDCDDSTQWMHQDEVNSVAISHNRTMCASASADAVIIWTLGNKIPAIHFINRIDSEKADINCVVFSPDDALFCTGSSDGQVQMFNTVTGDQVGEPFQFEEAVIRVAFSTVTSLLAIALYGTRFTVN
ncbi:WD40-repeat-containing domain protein, partial [Roridomyces roridus]